MSATTLWHVKQSSRSTSRIVNVGYDRHRTIGQTPTTNRLHGDALILANTMRDARQPLCRTLSATRSDRNTGLQREKPEYGSPAGIRRRPSGSACWAVGASIPCRVSSSARVCHTLAGHNIYYIYYIYYIIYIMCTRMEKLFYKLIQSNI